MMDAHPGGWLSDLRARLAAMLASRIVWLTDARRDARGSLSDAQRQRWDAEINTLVGSRRAPIYRLVDGVPTPVTVRIGASDGSSTEVAGEIAAGDAIIVRALDIEVAII